MYSRKVDKKKYRNGKIKEQYRNASEQESIPHYGWFKGLGVEMKPSVYTDFPNLRAGCHKKFSLKQEKSLFAMHEYEYAKEYNLKLRRKRSTKGLPDPWDDYPSYVWDLQKSWKHSTKRKRQYYK